MSDLEDVKKCLNDLKVKHEVKEFKNERISLVIEPEEEGNVVAIKNGWIEIKFNEDESFDRICIC